MKQKNYPIVVCGHIAAVTVDMISWNMAKISFKFKHRVGQSVKITHLEDPESVVIDEYRNYTAIRFIVGTQNFRNERSAIQFCKSLIDTVDYYVNFNSQMPLVVKELLAIFK